MQLVRQLEAVKNFEQVNNPSRFSYAGWWGEALLGAWLMGWNVARPSPPEFPWWGGLSIFIIGLALLIQGLLLIFRHHLDKRYRLLLEAILSIPDTVDLPKPQGNEKKIVRRPASKGRSKRR
jgi:hypothetical protein